MMPRRPLSLELLETRALPATFGIPWHDAGHLTLSFAPDGTAIAGHQSNLFQFLDSQIGAGAWQRELLRAFQTWAVAANINIGVVEDGGQPFGVPGSEQADPRFGDIRIGAQSMAADTLSLSVPPGAAISGTLSGDVLLNSAAAVDGTNLFPIFLHEAGHVFGLGDRADPASPLYPYFSQNTQLTTGDVAAIQALYGTRPPDLLGNDSFNTALQIKFPRDGYDGSTPIVTYGELGTPGDMDYFWVRPPDGYQGPATLRLQTAGLSLLEPRFSVYDANHRLLGQVASQEAAGAVLTIHLDQVSPKDRYFLQVEAAATDVMGIGRYGIGVTFDGVSSVTTATLAAILRGPYETLHTDDLNRAFEDPSSAFFNDSNGAEDSPVTALALKTTPGYLPQTHYEMIASLTPVSTQNFYRIKAADARPGEPNVMTITIRALDINGVAAKISVLDNNQNRVPAEVLVNGNATYTIQVAQAQSGVNYFLEAFAADPVGNASGNFSLVVNFGNVAAELETFAAGTLDAGHSQDNATLYIAESQLFHFTLSADSLGNPESLLHMAIYDSNDNLVFQLDGGTGDAVSGSVFLTPGAYTVVIRAETPGGDPIPGLTYKVRGLDLTDPIGTALDDPTTQPIYLCDDDPSVFCYPGDIVSPDPFLWVA